MSQMKRSELYQLVWAEPRNLLAPKYGISDVGLGKLCRRHDIPMPPRGYWAKKAAGKSPKQIALPDPVPDREVELRREPWSPKPSTPTEPIDEFPLTQLQNDVDRRVAYEAMPENYIKVDSEPRKLHPLARQHKGPRRLSSLNPTFRREVLILNALFLAMESRGFELLSGNKFRIFHAEVEFRIRELTSRTINPDVKSAYKYVFVANGRLIVEIANAGSCSDSWRDGPKGLLEGRLNQVIEGFTLNAAKAHEHDADMAVWQSQYELRRLQEKRAESARADVRRRQNHLIELVSRWTKAIEIRKLIAEIKLNQKNGRLAWMGPVSLEDWLSFARETADGFDPTIGQFSSTDFEVAQHWQ